MDQPSLKNFRHEQLTDRQCEQFDNFAQLLIAESKLYNLTSITEIEQIHTRHFRDSLQTMELPAVYQSPDGGAGSKKRLLDIGSGAGLPALALAIAFDNWQITSLEATGKKVRFQEKVIETLGLSNAVAIQGRAEEIAHTLPCREQFDIVTARAVASLPILLEMAVGFLKPAGIFIAWKGGDIDDELKRAEAAAEQLGARIEEILPYRLPSAQSEDKGSKIEDGDSKTERTFALIVFKKLRATDKHYPRPYKQIKKSPLGTDAG